MAGASVVAGGWPDIMFTPVAHADLLRRLRSHQVVQYSTKPPGAFEFTVAGSLVFARS
jgi:hypothetical protein